MARPMTVVPTVTRTSAPPVVVPVSVVLSALMETEGASGRPLAGSGVPVPMPGGTALASPSVPNGMVLPS